MRLIDGDALKAKFCSWLPKDPQEGGTEVENIAVSALMEIEEAPTVDVVEVDWISVQDRLPEDEALILAYHPNFIIPTPGQKTHDVDRITIKFGWYCRRSALGITHWMPLPKPPRIEDSCRTGSAPYLD